MGIALRMLHIEDVPEDAELVLRALKRGGYEPSVLRVDNALDMSDALDREPWDLIISDYNLPAFDAPAALSLLQAHDLDIPFIIVSGTVGEPAAVTAMKAGAHDYLNKGNLKRLAPAVARELQEARNRAEYRRSEQTLRQSEASFRGLIEHLPNLVLVHRDGAFIYVNPTALSALGYAHPEELLGFPLDKVVHRDDLDLVNERVAAILRGERMPPREQRWVGRDGTVLTVLVSDQSIVFDGVAAAAAVTCSMLEASNQAQVAAGGAHEIGSSLAKVVAQLDFVLEALRARARAGTPGLDELENPLSEAREAADRLRFVFTDLKVLPRAGRR